MADLSDGLRIAACLLCLAVVAVATAAPLELDPNPGALVQAMQGHRIVLLGEVHDNAIQHALRAAALRQWIEQGAPYQKHWAFESPVKAKFDKLIPQLEMTVGDKVTVDVGPAINKNIQALTESVGTKLRIATTAQ